MLAAKTCATDFIFKIPIKEVSSYFFFFSIKLVKCVLAFYSLYLVMSGTFNDFLVPVLCHAFCTNEYCCGDSGLVDFFFFIKWLLNINALPATSKDIFQLYFRSLNWIMCNLYITFIISREMEGRFGELLFLKQLVAATMIILKKSMRCCFEDYWKLS